MEQTITVLAITRDYNSTCHVPEGAEIVDFFSDDGALFCLVLHDIDATQIPRSTIVEYYYSSMKYPENSTYMGKYKDRIYVMGPE